MPECHPLPEIVEPLACMGILGSPEKCSLYKREAVFFSRMHCPATKDRASVAEKLETSRSVEFPHIETTTQLRLCSVSL